MLEIIALVYLTRKMGQLALQKGLKSGQWKLFMVLTWFGCEFIGAFIGFVLFKDIAPALLIGYGLAIASYFVLKAVLAKKPNQMPDDEIERIGKPQFE